MKQIILPEYYRTELSNGLIVYIMPIRSLPLTNFSIVFPGGGSQDSKEDTGCANLISELLNKGSERYNATTFIREVERIGGILHAVAQMDYSAINGEFLTRHLGKGIELLAEMVRMPVFPQAELEKSKRQIIGELTAHLEEPSYLANVHFRNCLFNNHPYGRVIQGNNISVNGISRGKCIASFNRLYRAKNAIFVIVGDCDKEEVLALIQKYFGDWHLATNLHDLNAEISQAPSIKIRLVDKVDMTQTQIRLGNLGIARKDPAYYPVAVMNTILGGGFTSRLVREIRVKRGLSYGAWSKFSPRMQRGEYVIGTFTKNSTVGEVIEIIIGEIRKLQNETLEAEELIKAKKYLTGLFPSSLEPPENLARYLTDMELFGLDRDYIMQHCQRITAVESDELRRCAQTFLPAENPVIVAVGAASQIQKALERFGPVETVPYTEPI